MTSVSNLQRREFVCMQMQATSYEGGKAAGQCLLSKAHMRKRPEVTRGDHVVCHQRQMFSSCDEVPAFGLCT